MKKNVEAMPKSKQNAQRDELPEDFASIEALWDFWDSHSSADYEDLMEPVELFVELSSTKSYLFVVKDLYPRIRQRAHEKGISTETLVNLWLQEKLAEAA